MLDNSLTITLIQQDLKHSQLTEILRKIGLDDGGLYSLNLISVVAKLMQVPPHHMEAFVAIYCGYLDQAPQWPTSHNGKELLIAAKECYLKLLQCLC